MKNVTQFCSTIRKQEKKFIKNKFPSQVKYLPKKLSFKVEKVLIFFFFIHDLFLHINRHRLR